MNEKLGGSGSIFPVDRGDIPNEEGPSEEVLRQSYPFVFVGNDNRKSVVIGFSSTVCSYLPVFSPLFPGPSAIRIWPR